MCPHLRRRWTGRVVVVSTAKSRFLLRLIMGITVDFIRVFVRLAPPVSGLPTAMFLAKDLDGSATPLGDRDPRGQWHHRFDSSGGNGRGRLTDL
ncbi:MAG: hypothetical protein HRU37_12390, partial [Roseibacillus sp.]|nr:hypothetical protein [Roseibacillus sp.]